MGLRDVMQSNPMAVATVAVVVIVMSVFWTLRGEEHSPRPDQVYFYDLDTGELFAGARTARPPIDTPGGVRRGVKAEVYACGDCGGELRIAYLTTYSDEAIEAMKQLDNADPAKTEALSQVVDRGTLIASSPAAGQAVQWMSAFSSQGLALMAPAARSCSEGEAVTCFPNGE